MPRIGLLVRGPVLALLALLPATAHAQLSFSGSVESDDRFRGLSLSNGQPVLGLGVAYDHPSGAYAGASALGWYADHARLLGFVEYAGYAFRRSPQGPTFDVGVDNENLDTPYPGGYANRLHSLAYSEVYAGMALGGVSAHVYYSPDYFRSGAGSVYASLDGAYRPSDDWRLTAHGGVTTPLNAYAGGAQHERYDLRLGVSRQFRNLEAHVAWTGYWPGPSTSTRATRPAVVAGVSVFF